MQVMASDGRDLLGEAMEDRRLELHLRWADVARAAGVTTETLRQIRAGSNELRPLTKVGIENALLWTRGSVDAVLAGGKPTPLRQAVDVGGGAKARLHEETARDPAAMDAIRDALAKLPETEPSDEEIQRRVRLIMTVAAEADVLLERRKSRNGQ